MKVSEYLNLETLKARISLLNQKYRSEGIKVLVIYKIMEDFGRWGVFLIDGYYAKNPSLNFACEYKIEFTQYDLFMGEVYDTLIYIVEELIARGPNHFKYTE